MRRVAPIVALDLFVLAVASPASAKSLCGREAQPSDAMVAAIVAEDGKVTADDIRFKTIDDPDHGILWTFVEDGLATGPAIVCRRVVTRDGVVSIEVSAHCLGPKPASDALDDGFRRWSC